MVIFIPLWIWLCPGGGTHALITVPVRTHNTMLCDEVTYMCDGTHMLPQGHSHSRVYGRVDIGTCARYRSCLCHIVRLAGNHVYEYSAAEHMARLS